MMMQCVYVATLFLDNALLHHLLVKYWSSLFHGVAALLVFYSATQYHTAQSRLDCFMLNHKLPDCH